MWPCGVQKDSDGLLIPKVRLELTCEIDIVLKDVYWGICILLRTLRLFPHVPLHGTGGGGGGGDREGLQWSIGAKYDWYQ